MLVSHERSEMGNVTCILFTLVQNEKTLYDAAKRGDMFAVRRLITDHVNVDCAPYQVFIHVSTFLWRVMKTAFIITFVLSIHRMAGLHSRQHHSMDMLIS